MRIGLTFDLKTERPPKEDFDGRLPDDWQEEFDSPSTIEAIAAVLRDLGHEVEWLGDGRGLLQRLLADPPDFVFNMAEGQGISRSREARVPAVLEMLGIPYTGSDPLTLAVTLDKDCAKRLVQAAGVAVPRGVVVDPQSSAFDPRSSIFDSELTYPLIVKPAWEGSSKGIRSKSVVESADELLETIESLQQDHCQPILIEEFVDGDELTVGILGNDPPEILGIMRVMPRQDASRFIYSLDVKRDFLRQVKYECPAQVHSDCLEAVRQATLTVYQSLGCRDVARVDFRLKEDIPYFLEVNPLPGLNPESSDLVIMARLCGWSHEKLIETIFQSALRRQQSFVNCQL
jgi:D-alanine-D-alanine ligase